MDIDVLLVDSITNKQECAEYTLDMSQADTNDKWELESCLRYIDSSVTTFLLLNRALRMISIDVCFKLRNYLSEYATYAAHKRFLLECEIRER